MTGSNPHRPHPRVLALDALASLGLWLVVYGVVAIIALAVS